MYCPKCEKDGYCQKINLRKNSEGNRVCWRCGYVETRSKAERRAK